MPQAFKPYKNKRNDGRIKILPSQHPEVRAKYKSLKSLRATARHYKVSHKLIFLIVHPERYAEYLRKRREEQAHHRYYDKTTHTQAMNKYRAKKKKHNLQYNPNK